MTTDSPSPLERRYRRILRRLPAGMPAHRTEEMAAVLLAAHDHRRRSVIAETMALVGMSGFAYLLIQLAASGLLWDPDRLRTGRTVLRSHLTWVAGALAGVFVLFARPFAVGSIGPVALSPLLLTLSLAFLTIIALGHPTGRASATAGLPLFAAFVAGHGWWSGVGDIEVFSPSSNAPGAAEMAWLLVLPVGTWVVIRGLGDLLARRGRRST